MALVSTGCFCSEDELSPTDASEDSVEVKVRPIELPESAAALKRHKRKSLDPKRLHEENDELSCGAAKIVKTETMHVTALVVPKKRRKVEVSDSERTKCVKKKIKVECLNTVSEDENSNVRNNALPLSLPTSVPVVPITSLAPPLPVVVRSPLPAETSPSSPFRPWSTMFSTPIPGTTTLSPAPIRTGSQNMFVGVPSHHNHMLSSPTTAPHSVYHSVYPIASPPEEKPLSLVCRPNASNNSECSEITNVITKQKDTRLSPSSPKFDRMELVRPSTSSGGMSPPELSRKATKNFSVESLLSKSLPSTSQPTHFPPPSVPMLSSSPPRVPPHPAFFANQRECNLEMVSPGPSIDETESRVGGSSAKHTPQQKQRNYKNMTRERRIEANARERTRVHTISAAFDTLRHSVPAYSHSQKLSKLSILRIACSYILTLSRLAGMDYSADSSEPPLSECVDLLSRTIQTEGKVRRKKDD